MLLICTAKFSGSQSEIYPDTKQMQRVVRDRDAPLLSAVQQCTLSLVLYIYLVLVITTETGPYDVCIDVDLTFAFYCRSL